MIIKTDVSEAHEAQIQSAAPYGGMGQTNWPLRRVLYYLAGRAEGHHLGSGGPAKTTDADVDEDIFAGAVEAAQGGEIE